MITIPWEFTFPKDKSGVVTSAILAIMLPPLKFDSAGNYIFELKIGRKCVARSFLYVQKISEQASENKGVRPPTRKK